MEKILSQIKVIESDEGFRIEVSGEKAKEWMKRGCLTLAGCCLPSSQIPGGKSVTECYPPEDKK